MERWLACSLSTDRCCDNECMNVGFDDKIDEWERRVGINTWMDYFKIEYIGSKESIDTMIDTLTIRIIFLSGLKGTLMTVHMA